MKILAVDLGKVRTGLAICDPMEVLASPLAVLRQTSRIAKEEGAQQLVLGLPKNMDGSEGESAQAARSFSKLLERDSGLPVILRDERGTTISAHEALNVTNTRGNKRKAVVDAVAAVIILQNYLDYRKNRGSVSS